LYQYYIDFNTNH
jgi:hypothetical protein